MKKFFAFVAMAAMLVACGEPDNGGNGGTNNGGGNYDIPASEITIDGNFSDWDALGDKASIATLPEGAVTYSQLKTLKLYADESFIHFFCEFDPANTLVFVPYFDIDSDGLTGNTSKWSGSGYEGKAEGEIWTWRTEMEYDKEVCVEQLEPKAWDPSFYLYNEHDDGTTTTDCVFESGTGAVISSVPCTTKDGLYAFEVSILRSILYAYNLGETFTMGMYQYNQNWACIGQLPCITDADKSAGELEYMLTVTLP